MKIIFRLFTIIQLIIVLVSCAAQKPATGRQGEAAGEELRHARASEALEEGQFVIEANEFYLPSDKSPVKSSTGNYISMEGKRGVISFTPDLFPKTPLGNLTIEDGAAEISLEKRKKNGDMQFCMRMTGPANSQDREVIITLYKDTDKCYVQVSNELLAYPVVKFTGVVRPAGK